jgi:RNA polymerase sigma factor (sigma-70 family)
VADSNASNSSVRVQLCLDRLRAGEEQARNELVAVSIERLRRLSRAMLKDQAGVRAWEETDDVLQNGVLRLWRALSSHHPETSLDYFRLAAQVLRRELIDLARHYFGPQGMATHQAYKPILRGDSSFGPHREMLDPEISAVELASWTDFHEQIDLLSADDRQMFDLLWYQGLNQAEAADLLGVSERTIQRRWQTARLSLFKALGGSSPLTD